MSKRRKKREIQAVWINDPCVDPIGDMQRYAALLRQPVTGALVLPEIYVDKLREYEREWLQSQDNVL